MSSSLINKVHQVYISDVENFPSSENILQKINQLKSVYKDCIHHVYTNEEIENLISENFDKEVLLAYKTVLPYSFKSDLARYCLLYVHGGYYFDIAIAPDVKLEFSHPVALVNGISDEIRTDGKKIIETSFVYSEKSHPFLKLMIDLIVDNILYKNYGVHPLDVTGPMVLYNAYFNYNNKDEITFLDCNFYPNGNRYASYNGIKFFDFKEKQHQANLSTLGCEGTNNYERMWFAKDIFNYHKSSVNKETLVYTDVDDDDTFLKWCSKENPIYDRAINYYGDNEERFNFIKSIGAEYIFKNKKKIENHQLLHTKLFNTYNVTIAVENDINKPIMKIKRAAKV